MTPDEAQRLSETLSLAAAGDQDAWRSIVEAYVPRVFRLLKAQCGNADLADEITQSTFCTVVTKLAGYTELGRFEQWLFRIAMNRLRDEMRRRKRHAVPVESETLGLLAGGVGGERPEFGAEDFASLDQALAQLGEADRSIIHLRHFAGLSFRQIAEMLEEPLGTVLARQHRALRKLRDLMEKGGDSGDEEGLQ